MPDRRKAQRENILYDLKGDRFPGQSVAGNAVTSNRLSE